MNDHNKKPIRGIKYISEAWGCGYGESARGYMRCLREAGIPLTWTPMVEGRGLGLWRQPFEGMDFEDDEFGDIVNRKIEYDVVILHVVPEYMSRLQERERGKTVIGMTVWELDTLPQHWRAIMNALDAVIVPCKWNRDVFQAGGITVPVGIIPHVIPPRVKERTGPLARVAPDDYVFYSIAAWRERNAPHLTLRSFLAAFRAEDKAVLVLKTSSFNERAVRPGFWWYRVKRHFASTEREIHSIQRECESSARIEVFTEPWPRASVEALHERGDCYVSLTHGEGWGLGAYEAAAFGKPVIITGHGGQLEFLPASLAYHVDFRLVPFDDPTMSRETRKNYSGYWAEPSIDDGAKLMRHVFANREEARERGLGLQQYVRERFDTSTITGKLVEFIRSVVP
ncbi:MAG: glycosyltransferase family 4 protein [Acidobacteriaceae bacterium]|nr:glycosyltransferase family 4 protein [Acidobacteriaceae bacterium]